MKTIKGNRVLSGTWAEMWFNGFLLAEMTKISVKVTINREDVQMGMDVDTKITGQKGEGTITLAKAFSRFEDVREEISKGRSGTRLGTWRFRSLGLSGKKAKW